MRKAHCWARCSDVSGTPSTGIPPIASGTSPNAIVKKPVAMSPNTTPGRWPMTCRRRGAKSDARAMPIGYAAKMKPFTVFEISRRAARCGKKAERNVATM